MSRLDDLVARGARFESTVYRARVQGWIWYVQPRNGGHHVHSNWCLTRWGAKRDARRWLRWAEAHANPKDYQGGTWQ